VFYNGVMDSLPEGLAERITTLLAEALHPEAIYLFGSHAYGTPHRHSDVDLLVVVGDTDEPAVSLYDRAEKSMRGIRAPVELVICQRSEWDRLVSLKTSLPNVVSTRGKLLYDGKARPYPALVG
jgi:predicted nucleotidyltransferase